MNVTQFPCEQCGADLQFNPGVAALKCPYCEFENEIPQLTGPIEELDFHAFLAEAGREETQLELQTVKCNSCGAESTLDENISSDNCPFCGCAIVAQSTSGKVLKPKLLLPFKVTREEATRAFRNWVAGLWFAPNALKRYATVNEKLSGMYIPYWTYDCYARTQYTGKRGTDYYVTETRTRTDSNGRTRTETVQVKKIRWTWVSGLVHNDFDDLLVLASNSLPRKYTEALEPWDLENLVGYTDAYLSGFRTETYHVGLEQGFEQAREQTESPIRRSIEHDIGGDHQRILTSQTSYENITFKHMLLPIWISAYSYQAKVYRFLVNARTGEVQGERPYSWIKIALTILLVLAIIAIIVFLMSRG